MKSKSSPSQRTEMFGSAMARTKAVEAFVVERIVSVRPNLNHRVAPLSYMAVGRPYSLQIQSGGEGVGVSQGQGVRRRFQNIVIEGKGGR